MTESETRCGFAALVGAPNAGKSTLINQLVGAKVSIVTHKAQTTRPRLRGTVMEAAAQITLVDTPGISPPTRPPARPRAGAAWPRDSTADRLLLVSDAPRRTPAAHPLPT